MSAGIIMFLQIEDSTMIVYDKTLIHLSYYTEKTKMNAESGLKSHL